MFQACLKWIFSAAFTSPTKSEQNLPKCKSNASRVAAFDFLLEMAKESPENFTFVHEILLRQNSSGGFFWKIHSVLV